MSKDYDINTFSNILDNLDENYMMYIYDPDEKWLNPLLVPIVREIIIICLKINYDKNQIKEYEETLQNLKPTIEITGRGMSNMIDYIHFQDFKNCAMFFNDRYNESCLSTGSNCNAILKLQQSIESYYKNNIDQTFTLSKVKSVMSSDAAGAAGAQYSQYCYGS